MLCCAVLCCATPGCAALCRALAAVMSLRALRPAPVHGRHCVPDLTCAACTSFGLLPGSKGSKAELTVRLPPPVPPPRLAHAHLQPTSTATTPGCHRPRLQDLTAYKKYRNKAVSSAARGLIALFRELAPGMLEKKDRGRGADMGRDRLAYGAAQVRPRCGCGAVAEQLRLLHQGAPLLLCCCEFGRLCLHGLGGRPEGPCALLGGIRLGRGAGSVARRPAGVAGAPARASPCLSHLLSLDCASVDPLDILLVAGGGRLLRI